MTAAPEPLRPSKPNTPATSAAAPNRPAAPPAALPTRDTVAATETDNSESADLAISRLQPIPPPSERLQFRAIGLVRGRYHPSEEGFNRGLLIADDGTELDAVLLGQVMSLVKKHIDLEQEHLWVVYPRTRKKQSSLHLQIVGVWEPENLQQAASTQFGNVPNDGYFSIRGEVLFQNEEKKFLVVRIQQSARKAADAEKSFKLRLEGTVDLRAPGYFWEIEAQRESNQLMVTRATSVALLPPKKGKKPVGDRPRSERGRSSFSRSKTYPDTRGSRDGGRLGERPSFPVSPRPEGSEERRPFTKPVKRNPNHPSPP